MYGTDHRPQKIPSSFSMSLHIDITAQLFQYLVDSLPLCVAPRERKCYVLSSYLSIIIWHFILYMNLSHFCTLKQIKQFWHSNYIHIISSCFWFVSLIPCLWLNVIKHVHTYTYTQMILNMHEKTMNDKCYCKNKSKILNLKMYIFKIT